LKKELTRKLSLYLLATVLAMALKQHYSTANAAQLRWILTPTAWLVSFFTQTAFGFVAGKGFTTGDQSIIIAPACAGLNFLLICFCTLTFSFMHHTKTARSGLRLMAVSGLTALGLTLAVNTGRIILSMRIPADTLINGPISEDRLHRLEGICVYFLALSILYWTAGIIAKRFAKTRDSRSTGPFPANMRRLTSLAPFFWYLMIMLGIPLLRKSYARDLASFIEHGLFVTIVPILILILVLGLKQGCLHLYGWSRIKQFSFATACLVPIILFCAWNPGPSSDQSFDSGGNGLWISGKWYTGVEYVSGTPLTSENMRSLITVLRSNRIRYAYVRAGEISESGTIEHMPSPFFFELQAMAPDIIFLPWVSGSGDKLALSSQEWRDRVVQSIGRLYSLGVRGIHLNIEPVRDSQPGYIELLQEIDKRMEGEFFVSNASRRITPMGINCPLTRSRFWSRTFYCSAMRHSNQTVLMGYNTALPSSKLYCAYIKHQTNLLLNWASDIEGHQVLIGIPAYEHVPHLSNPKIENVPNAISGIRASLESFQEPPSCFQGVSIYANWYTSPREWAQYQSHWLRNEYMPSHLFKPFAPQCGNPTKTMLLHRWTSLWHGTRLTGAISPTDC